MHLLAAVLVPFDAHGAAIRPLVARDAALWARLDMLLFRFQQPEEWAWGTALVAVSYSTGGRLAADGAGGDDRSES